MDYQYLRNAIRPFLAEDIGAGDLTSEAIFAPEQIGGAEFVAKADFIAAGLATVAALVFQVQNPAVQIQTAVPDGQAVKAGEIIFKIRGPLVDLLKAERVALNLAQRLCGIATLTARFVEQVRPFAVRIVDTRKTAPGLRIFEKYAVRAGGGYNHRFNLAAGVMIKDNHIAACGSIPAAVRLVRRQIPHTMKIEVEAATLAQVRDCLACAVEIILLDNMDLDQLTAAVKLAKGKALLEASGGVTLDNVRAIAATGVDLISVGCLTHSAPACDISMRYSA